MKKKATFRLLESVIKAESSGASFMPLIQHLVEEKAEIISDADNIVKVMEKFSAKGDSVKKLLALATNETLRSDPQLFVSLIPFLTQIKTKVDLGSLADHGIYLLESEGDNLMRRNGEALVELINAFLGRIVENGTAPKCWKFLSERATSKLQVEINGVVQPLAAFALTKLAETEITDKTLAEKLFTLLIDASNDCDVADTLIASKNTIEKLPITAENVNEQLVGIWGSAFFNKKEEKLLSAGRLANRGRLSEKYGPATTPMEVDPKDDENWSKTFFLLESTCYRGFDRSEILLKPLFSLLSKSLATQDENPESAYAIDLVLSYVLNVFEGKSEQELAKMGPVFDFDVPNSLTRNRDNFKDPYHFNSQLGKKIVKVLVDV